MRKVYFHIGFGKTGSSSLQAYLSFNPLHEIKATQEKLLYCSFEKNGKLLHGNELIEAAQNSPLKYSSSYPGIAEFGDLGVVKAEIDKIFEQGFTPIFSQEDWGRRAGHFKNSDFFDQLDVDVSVIVYVRPQVDWFNSAWWQWFAWAGQFELPGDVIKAWGCNFILWGSQIASWKRLRRVKDVSVRLHPSDIVEDFMGILGATPVEGGFVPARNNVSLSPTLIKLLKKYPSLRDTHSADVDSILSRFVKFEGKTPWFIEPQLVNQIIDATREDNLKLMGMLDEPSRRLMENDPRWWDVGHYETRKLWREEDFQLTEGELYSIIEQVIPALIKVGRESANTY